ncbi:radical SAM/SPASM domain-containing protein [Aminipila terrae]|uniref:Radical SAM protein n=1 Tax=Aminipila terrae TaxID=2697030 RepID=A0A6P1MIY1_9FIRM|nr:radical SAM protein [Aminipila terrae]QHI71948.1 radical SAM protein [Aminipila terrae]
MMLENRSLCCRKFLKDVVPLEEPYTVQFNLINVCNFRCQYCSRSLNNNNNNTNKAILMDFNIYKKAIDQLKRFRKPIRKIILAGFGEPLLHKDIIEMIKYASKSQVAENIEIVTNGSLLTHEMSDAIVAAGLTNLRISVNGLSNEDFVQYTSTKVDFNKYYQEIKYFYENSKQVYVKIKILDYMVNEEREQVFLNLFSNISDCIAIESLQPIVDDIDYTALTPASSFSKAIKGNHRVQSEICAQPFYTINIDTEGNITPCCVEDVQIVMGNVCTDDIYKIWSGEKFNQLRIRLLKGHSIVQDECSICSVYLTTMTCEDVLDSDSDRIISLLERRDV